MWHLRIVRKGVDTILLLLLLLLLLLFYGATARGGPRPPLQYVSKPLDPLLYLSIRLFPSSSGP
jgi:hypothetical protein